MIKTPLPTLLSRRVSSPFSVCVCLSRNKTTLTRGSIGFLPLVHVCPTYLKSLCFKVDSCWWEMAEGGFDPCECICSQEYAMRRLINLVSRTTDRISLWFIHCGRLICRAEADWQWNLLLVHIIQWKCHKVCEFLQLVRKWKYSQRE